MLTQDALGAALSWAQPWLAPVLSPWFTLLGAAVTPLEVCAFVLSLWMVWCNLQVRVLAWPLAIAASAAYGVLFLHFRLYGEASLQGMFIALSAWGWWRWARAERLKQALLTSSGGEQAASLDVGALTARQRWAAALSGLLLWPLLALVLTRWTDTDVPWWDALPTAGSVVGQVLLARKRIENWAVWALVNVVSVGLFAWKQLWLTAVLYALFTVLSCLGWRAWARRMQAPAPQVPGGMV
jgi:nicotinamide mononucleotide transporter